MDIDLSVLDKDLMEMTVALEDLHFAVDGLQSAMGLSVGLESKSSVIKVYLEKIWEFIVRIGAAVARVFGMVGNTSTTLRYSLESIERRLRLHKGRRPKEPYIALKHEANYVMAGNKVLQSPSEYNAHLSKLVDTLSMVMTHHISALRKTSDALKRASGSSTKDPVEFLNEVATAASTIDLDALAGRLSAKPLVGDNRFPRTRPIYKGPDIIGNRSIFIDLPMNAVSGHLSDINKAIKVSETTVSYLASYQTVHKTSGDIDIRSADYNEISDMVKKLYMVLDHIDKYPINDLKRDQRVLEDSFKEISKRLDVSGMPKDHERYIKTAARILTAYGTWISNPHTQLITSSLTVTRGMITVINRHIKNF